MTDERVWDAAVIGGGPAGMSAATWLARYRCTATVVDAGKPRNRFTEQMHGYLGFDPAAPSELLERARKELTRYESVRIVGALATGVRREEDAFTVDLEEHPPVRAKRIVLATGMRDSFPDIEGFFDHYGTSVFHCPACDGYEARNAHIVVLGWDAHVADFAVQMKRWASSVTVVTDGRRFDGDDAVRAELRRQDVPLTEQTAAAFIGARGALEAVVLRDGSRIDCSFAFFSIAHTPHNDLARRLGCDITEEGCVDVDADGRTSADGVFACGDVTPGTQLVQVAAAKGTLAGIACARSLREPRLRV